MQELTNVTIFPMTQIINVAVEGCCHGDLDRIYSVLEQCESRRNVSADFMICCGDFQAIRTEYVFLT
jgi:hypothetical protein